MNQIWKWKIQSPKPLGLVGISSSQTTVAITHIIYDEGGVPKVSTLIEAQYTGLAAKQQIIKNFVLEQGLQGADCAYVLANGQYTLALLEAPKVTPAELPKATRWLMQELVSFPIHTACVDAFFLPIPRSRDNQTMAYGVAMPEVIVAEIQAELESSGLLLQYIDIPELALRNVVHCHPKEMQGCLLLHLQPQECQMIFSKSGEFLLTRKLDFSVSGSDENQLEMFALEIQRSLDYFISNFQQSIQTVILTTYNDTHVLIKDYLKKSLNIVVDDLSLNEYLQCKSKDKIKESNESLLAVGAALRLQK